MADNLPQKQQKQREVRCVVLHGPLALCSLSMRLNTSAQGDGLMRGERTDYIFGLARQRHAQKQNCPQINSKLRQNHKI
jgi:hypothetical protein